MKHRSVTSGESSLIWALLNGLLWIYQILTVVRLPFIDLDKKPVPKWEGQTSDRILLEKIGWACDIDWRARGYRATIAISISNVRRGWSYWIVEKLTWGLRWIWWTVCLQDGVLSWLMSCRDYWLFRGTAQDSTSSIIIPINRDCQRRECIWWHWRISSWWMDRAIVDLRLFFLSQFLWRSV